MLISSNISVVLVVFMGMTSGGMLALMLMAGRKQQAAFAVMLLLSGFLALLGAANGVMLAQNMISGLVSAAVLLVLSFALGYTLTTFSVLSPKKEDTSASAPDAKSKSIAVICLTAGEPPEYETRNAAKRFELADDEGDVRPVLLRPFQMNRLKAKYETVGHSPYRDYQVELSRKVQARLEGSHRVYPAFYGDHPSFTKAIAQAVEDGARNIVVAPIQVTDLPEAVNRGDLIESLDSELLGSRVAQIDPLWESDLLPQIYVRRILEAMPHVDIATEDVGVLLIGRGHSTANVASSARHEQEHYLQRKVRKALLRAGFDESRVVTGWMRETPTPAEALIALHQTGCKSVYWMPSSFAADGIDTLYDIPAVISSVAVSRGIRLIPVGAWNADDLAAEEIASRVRAASRVAVGRAL